MKLFSLSTAVRHMHCIQCFLILIMCFAEQAMVRPVLDSATCAGRSPGVLLPWAWC
jgi:hypothetical protein